MYKKYLAFFGSLEVYLKCRQLNSVYSQEANLLILSDLLTKHFTEPKSLFISIFVLLAFPSLKSQISNPLQAKSCFAHYPDLVQ